MSYAAIACSVIVRYILMTNITFQNNQDSGTRPMLILIRNRIHDKLYYIFARTVSSELIGFCF